MRHGAGSSEAGVEQIEVRLAARLAGLRAERGWSLEILAARTGISRSTLSRLERAEISASTAWLSRLCLAYETTMSQLLAEVEQEPPQLIPAERQLIWRDEASGFTRRSVSAPHPGLRGELIECHLHADADISYAGSPVPGLEHHVWVLEGALEVTLDATEHYLRTGDCLRFRLHTSSRFRAANAQAVRYVLVVVLP
ncbi:helix-turn-helix domain-containing protein [Nocardia noduli]|uniref:helix-turn-helix domain-containing protein n=1 Tax=Nocardia noduli TaxID=2815722 RepID=UPI001C230376|nr:XRE family transcriptional regulator [Nocardia noduli]